MENFLNTIKKIKPVELIIITGVLIALFVGFLTFKHFRQTASKQIEATSQISFDVYIRGITFTGSELPIKINDQTFISIRNVPYTDLIIKNVKADRKKTIVPVFNTKNPKTLAVTEDVSQPYVYDAVVPKTALLSAVTRLKSDCLLRWKEKITNLTVLFPTSKL